MTSTDGPKKMTIAEALAAVETAPPKPGPLPHHRRTGRKPGRPRKDEPERPPLPQAPDGRYVDAPVEETRVEVIPEAYVSYKPSELDFKAETVDPSLHNAWLRNTPQGMAKAIRMGWRVVDVSELKPGHSGVVKPDGTVVDRDTILMVQPMAVKEARERKRQEDMVSMDRAVNRRLDDAGGLETGADHRKEVRGGGGSRKFYSIP